MNENENSYVPINPHENYPDSQQTVEVPTMKVMPLKKICMTIGELPTSYLETMTYYEMLIWFINYLRDNIIPTVNANGEATEELQVLFVELQDYVNNFKDSIDEDVESLETFVNDYFENLDVQDEIDHKLDEYLADGTLEHIIASYLQTQKIYDTHDEMVADASNLVVGLNVQTLGYHSVNDGGGAFYKITDTASEQFYQDNLGDDLYASLIETKIKPEYFGAYSDGTHKTETTAAFENMFDYVYSKQITVESETIAPEIHLYGTYTIDNITLTNDLAIIRIIGHKARIFDGGFVINTTSGWKVLISGITFQNCENPILMQYRNIEYGRYEIKDCIFKDCTGKAIDIKRRSCQTIIENNTFRGCEYDTYVEDSDMFIFRKNWLECYRAWDDNHSAVYHYCPNEGTALIEDNMFIPGYSQTATNPCWLRVGRNANIRNNRFSGENASIYGIRIEYDAISSFNENSTVYPIININDNPILQGNIPVLLGEFKGRINIYNNSGGSNGKQLIKLLNSETFYQSLSINQLYISIKDNAGRAFNYRRGYALSIPVDNRPMIPAVLYKFVQNEKLFAGNYNPNVEISTSNSDHTINIKYLDVTNDMKQDYVSTLIKGTINKNPGGSGNYFQHFIILVGLRNVFESSELRYYPTITILSTNPDSLSFTATLNGQAYLTAIPSGESLELEIAATSPAVATFKSTQILEFTPIVYPYSN